MCVCVCVRRDVVNCGEISATRVFNAQIKHQQIGSETHREIGIDEEGALNAVRRTKSAK